MWLPCLLKEQIGTLLFSHTFSSSEKLVQFQVPCQNLVGRWSHIILLNISVKNSFESNQSQNIYMQWKPFIQSVLRVEIASLLLIGKSSLPGFLFLFWDTIPTLVHLNQQDSAVGLPQLWVLYIARAWIFLSWKWAILEFIELKNLAVFRTEALIPNQCF